MRPVSKNAILICIVLIVFGGLGLLGVTIAYDGELEQIMGWYALITGQVIANLFGILRNEQIKTTTEQVQEQTNGQLHTLIEKVAEKVDVTVTEEGKDTGSNANKHYH